jgi:hydroxymethylpyrimidine/phosphomethylpyrimidine kinase
MARARAPRVPREFHGAGCHFASFLAGFAARGLAPDRAFFLAHGVLQQAVRKAERPGRGPAFLQTPAQRFVVEDGIDVQGARMAWQLAEAVAALTASLDRTAVPEVGMNFAFARARARSAADVCAVDGRIIVSEGRAVAAGPIRFGGSRHLARILLATARVAPSVRSACNVKYSEALVRRARRARLSVATFDRAEEPKGPRTSTMSWGTAAAIRSFGRVPDLIADQGAPGKEPMVRILGRDPADVLRKARLVVPP